MSDPSGLPRQRSSPTHYFSRLPFPAIFDNCQESLANTRNIRPSPIQRRPRFRATRPRPHYSFPRLPQYRHNAHFPVLLFTLHSHNEVKLVLLWAESRLKGLNDLSIQAEAAFFLRWRLLDVAVTATLRVCWSRRARCLHCLRGRREQSHHVSQSFLPIRFCHTYHRTERMCVRVVARICRLC